MVNTCGFIEDAKKEAIDNILEMAQLKQEGTIRAVVVTGCLAERYREEVKKESRRWTRSSASVRTRTSPRW